MRDKTIESTQLFNYFNNIAEFAKLNDLDCFDFGQYNGEIQEEHFIRGLLLNLEFLAHKWKLIDEQKYAYRKNSQHIEKNLLPQDAFCQNFFDIRTFKLAFNRVYMKTFEDQEV